MVNEVNHQDEGGPPTDMADVPRAYSAKNSGPLALRARRAIPHAWIAYPIFIFLALAAWSISSPIGSSPDEDFHLISSWCALGERDGLCTAGSNPTSRTVPAQLVEVSCYQLDREASGLCDSPDGVTETSRGNFAAQYYPNGYYTVMGLLSGRNIERSVIGMRLLNAAIYSIGLGALLGFTHASRRRSYMLGSLVSLVPLGLFTIASVNPSSWAITSATLLWAASVETGMADSVRQRVALIGVVAGGVLLAIASRADAVLYALVALALAAATYLRTRKQVAVTALVSVAIGALALWWLTSLGSFTQALDSSSTAHSGSWNWFLSLQGLPGLYTGVFGTSYLGWLDTPMEPITWVFAAGAYAMVFFWGLFRPSAKKTVSLATILMFGAAIPMVLQYLHPNALIQSRYLLPIVVITAMIATSDAAPTTHALGRAQSLVLMIMLATSHANALHSNMRRYLTGTDNMGFDLNTAVEWWWPWAPQPMTVFAFGAIAFGCLTYLATAPNLYARVITGTPESPQV